MNILLTGGAGYIGSHCCKELSNTIERAISLTDGPTIEAVHISLPQISEWQAAPPPSKHLRLSSQEEKELIHRAL